MSETFILIRLLRIYFPRILEFGSALEFRGEGFEPPKPPSALHWFRHPLLLSSISFISIIVDVVVVRKESGFICNGSDTVVTSLIHANS
jgi:hypothetical protein